MLIDAVQKHNDRNPGQTILYLNYAAVDPDFTNSKCSFWHFRFDANSDMKMEALTTYMAKDPKIKNVYLINQNYSFGQAVTRAAKEYLARKRPRHQDRRRRPAPARPGQGFRAPTSPRSRLPAPTPSSPATGATTCRC